MGKTIAEKIIARVAGKAEVSPGEVVWVQPDLSGACDSREPSSSITSVIPDLEGLVGVTKMKNPEKLVLIVDLRDPAGTVEDAIYQAQARDWARKYGVRFYQSRLVGLNHQAVVEMGLVRPGMFYAHNDTEVALVGGIGALAVGTMPLIEIYVTGETWLRVPSTIRFNFHGILPEGVLGRDVMHFVMSRLRPDEALYRVMEFGGSAIASMSIDSRMSMCSMANHFGAKSGIVNPDQKTIEYIKSMTDTSFDPVVSDEDAVYERIYDFDVSGLEPYVAVPPNVLHTKPLREVQGVPINQGYIGSCGGGRIEDLRAAATILRGRQVDQEVRLFIVPNTPTVLRSAEEEGLLRVFIDAGVFISSPSCNFCFGQCATLGPGEVAITTNTLNIPGRMGSDEAEIYLANAYAVAASAIEGKIADPRNYL